MLEEQDLKAIAALIAESEKRTKTHFDEMNIRFDKVDGKFEEIDKRFDEVNEKFEEIYKRFDEMDEKFEEIDKRLDEVNKKFEEIDRKFEEINGKFKEIDRQFVETEEQFKKVNKHLGRLDKGFKFLVKQIRELKEMDENILEEISYVHNRLDKRIDHVESKLVKIQEYYRLHKLGDDNTVLLLKMHKELEKRVEALERV